MSRTHQEVKANEVTVEIVILAIAAFLGMRLYSGRRAEHGEEPVQSRLDPGCAAAPAALLPERAVAGGARPRELGAVLPGVERGLREIIAVDRRLTP
jgi:hypothetical protein